MLAMPNLNKLFRPTHADRLDRWLGAGQTEVYSEMFRNWYGPPVALAGVPGAVYVTGGGDFVGPIKGGGLANLMDFAYQRQRRVLRNFMRTQSRTLHGFSSLSDLISEATTGGKSQMLVYNKTATTATSVNNAFSLFNMVGLPVASGVGGTSGTGRKCVRTTQGALGQTNAAGGDTLHLTTWTGTASVVAALMLCDRLWDMTYNHATSLSTAVDASNRPDRYQATGTAPGSFISGEITTQLSGTAHNLTVTYVDDAGNTAEAAAAYAAPTSAVVGRAPVVAGGWFVPLNTGDRGARYVTNIAQSTITSVTGVTSWFVAHPICMMPFPVANIPFVLDGINSAFNLQRIYDDACLFFYTPNVPTTGTIGYSGLIQVVSG
jgi:hypothetical protein